MAKKKYSEKMQWLLDHIPSGKIIDKYEDRNITEVTIKQGGDFLTYRLYITQDGEWMVTER